MHEYKHIHILECTQFTFTLMVQVYNSVMTKYVPKRIHFSLEGMIARTQLAALDHNFNVGREHSTIESGEERFKVQYSRQKGDYVAKKIYEEKNYGYVGAMMAQVVDVAKGNTDCCSCSETQAHCHIPSSSTGEVRGSCEIAISVDKDVDKTSR